MIYTKFGRIFNVMYCEENIPKSFVKLLKDFSPSMVSSDESSFQYDADIIINEYDINSDMYTDKDEIEFIKVLKEFNVNYIEI